MFTIHRREQNRNAAARSRARKNAMISKVIQLHQENMGLRAFIAEDISERKMLRDEVNRLNSTVAMIQHQHTQQLQHYHAMLAAQTHQSQTHIEQGTNVATSTTPTPQTTTTTTTAPTQQSSLFEIINQDSLFQNEGQ